MYLFLQELRYGARVLRKSPAFTAVAVLSLAIGIGANTAIFSVVDAVLLRPLAVAHPESLMLVQESWRGRAGYELSVGNFSDIRAQQNVFERVSAAYNASFNLAAADAPERISGAYVSSDWFETVGVPPLRGRTFSEQEQQRGQERVAVLSESLWRTRFDADPGLVGRDIQINGLAYRVVGIMPRSFDPLLDNSAIWLPAAFTPAQLADHDNHFMNGFARLKPDVSRAQARAALAVMAERAQRLYPLDDKERGFTLTPITDALLGDQRVALLTMLAAVGFVLLIACANIANLQLARARVRRKEIAVRVALGATPWRIVRQLLAENLALAGVGAVLGVLLAFWGLSGLVAYAPADVPRIDQSRVDAAALLFAASVALLSSVLFGLAPALRSAAARLSDAFKEGAGTSSVHRDRIRGALVVGEIALALMLLVAAGLLIRSTLVVAHLDPGFPTSNLTVGRVGLPNSAYRDPVVARHTFESILESVAALPGVDAAAIVSRAPMTDGGNSNGLLAEGKPLDVSNLVDAQLRVVSPGYLSVARVPLKMGRGFTAQDTRDTALVTLVNETLARVLWPGENPIGKRFACCEAGPKGRTDPVWHQVVGVVGDVRAWGLDRRVRPEFYLPLAQMPSAAWDWIGRTMDLVVRTRGGAAPIAGVRAAVARIAPGVPLYGVSTMQEKISSRLEQSHFDAFLLGIFAATALLLACVGVYGVLSYMVAQRTRDIGIRMALGASRERVTADILSQGARLTALGIAVGLVAAFAATRLLSSMLYAVRANDLITYCAVSALLAIVALLASYLPARRASRVDPMVALRHE